MLGITKIRKHLPAITRKLVRKVLQKNNGNDLKTASILGICRKTIRRDRGNDQEFIRKAQSWQDAWNTARPYFGIDMKGKTPLDKLTKKGASPQKIFYVSRFYFSKTSSLFLAFWVVPMS